VQLNGATLGPSAGSDQTLDAVAGAPAPRRWPGVLAVLVAVLAAYSLVVLIGVRQDARDERILGSLTPVFEWLRDNGAATQDWLQTHRRTVGLIGSGALLAIVVAALARRGRRAAPVVLLAVTCGLAAWAQVSLQSNDTRWGTVLYLAALASAIGLGIWCPLRRLATYPPFPPPPGGARRGLPWAWECVLVVVLTVAALLARSWALTELYDFFDLETIDWIVQGRTWGGFLGYLDYGFVQNNGGSLQLLPPQITFRLFGTSIFTLRMTSVLWGIAGVPLMYGLGRRLGGVTAGVFAAVFFITAPEQLFWSRNENLHFAPMAVCALVTAHLALWMVERFALSAVIANALWMPWCRWFYSACMVAFLIPIATSLHALVFARGLWRKAWYVVPLIALGLVFWIFSLSILRASLHDWQWQFVDPAAIYGGHAWRKHGEYNKATLPELVQLQAVSMSTNFAEVLRNMSHNTDGFSHWCQRSQPVEHRTILNVGVTLILFVGLGYFLGQVYDRRAFLLVACWAIATLPAILSMEPADRRMAMVFPFSHVLAGTALAAFLTIVHERGGRIAEALAVVAAAIGVAVIAITNLTSHLSLPINPILFSDYPRFTRPLFERSDAIFTNVPLAFRTFSVFGNLDHFLADPTCLQFVEPGRWLATALDPRCTFDDPVYKITVGDQALDGLRQRYQPKTISYLLTEEPSSAPSIALLRALHPDAPFERRQLARAERTLVAMTVDIDDILKLRSPAVVGAPGNTPILAGVALQSAAALGDGTTPPGVTVEGGVAVDADGWYLWRLDPACADAQLSVAGEPVLVPMARPLLAGVHPFQLTLPGVESCPLPLRIVLEGLMPRSSEPLAPQRYVSSAVAALPEVRAARVDSFEGYPAPKAIVQFPGRPTDFGVDAQGNVSVLTREGEHHRIRRYDRTGKPLAEWIVPTPFTINPASLAVAADGTTAVLVQRTIRLYDPQGREIAAWEHPWLVWETQLHFWGDYLVGNIHHRDALAVYSRKGELVREFKDFTGGPGKLYAPMALAIGRDGDLLVEQLDGLALRFRLAGPGFDPVFVEQFRTDTSTPGSAFDNPDRILVTSDRGLRVYGRGGRRLMASDPRLDPSQQRYGADLRIHRDGDRLLLLDSDRQTLWTIPG
jgi:hypothetical protein